MCTTIAIRAADVGDFPAICSINSQCVPAVAILAPEELDHVLEPTVVAWVALVGGVVAGYLLGYTPAARYEGEEFAWFRSKGHDFLYVDQIAIRSRARRQGIGAALYDALEAHARRQRLASLACEVNIEPPNPGSMAFHLRRGFAEAGRLRTLDGRYVALLRKRL